MKRLLIIVVFLVFIGGMIAGCQVASRPRPMGKGILSSEEAESEANDKQSVSSTDSQDASKSYDEERMYLYAGSEYDH